MSAPSHLPKSVRAVWDEIVEAYGAGSHRIVGPELEAYCGQIATLRDAQARLDKEGRVVADAKGNPIPHPALEIEKSAQQEIRKWSESHSFKRAR